jgi:PhzF family phenazine biosynthesis protein
MKEYKVYKVDAFTKIPLKGNPAAVVLDYGDLDDKTLLAIAAELNISETAFVKKIGEKFHVRFFTPGAEVPLCGHATIATFHLLKSLGIAKRGYNKMLTKAGELDILVEEKVWMQQLPPKILGELDIEALKSSLNTDKLIGPALVATTGLDVGIVGIPTFRELMELKPKFNELAEYCKESKIVGIHVYTFDSKYDAATRFFAPAVGVPEDPVTGTANAALAGYLKFTNKLVKEEYAFEQGHALNREGVVYVKLKDDEIWVGGDAVCILEGVLRL